MISAAARPAFRLDRLSLCVGAVLLAVTIGAWAFVVNMEMDHDAHLSSMAADSMPAEDEAMPATEVHDLGMESPRDDLRMRLGVSEQMQSWPRAATIAAFLGGWLAMMAAMMFPAASPMVTMFARSARRRYARGRSSLLIGIFIAGYLAAWGLFGLGVYALNEGVGEASVRWEWVLDSGPYLGGALLIAAGIYQVTWFKQACLQKCRSPLSFIMQEWRDGSAGALRMGAKHGLYCLGCCIGLMAGLIVAGVMSIGWMVTLAVLIFAEKVTRWGPQIARVTAAVMVIAGAALIVYGEKLPGIV